jgi:hypothetical protein
VLCKLGRTVGNVVVDKNVIGDDDGAVFYDKYAPSDGVLGNTEKNTEACVA